MPHGYLNVESFHEVAYDIGLDHGVTMSVHVRTRSDYEAADSAFIQTVRREATTVADRSATHD